MLHNYKLKKQNIRMTGWKCEKYLTYFLTVCWSHKSTYIDRMLPSLYTTWDTQNHNGCQESSKAVFSWKSHNWLRHLEICLLLQTQAHHDYKSRKEKGIIKAKTDKKHFNKTLILY